MNNLPLLKVCGMREAENISKLAALNPDLIGFIFHKKSPRYVKVFPKTHFPKGIKRVGVFVDESLDYVLKKVRDHQLSYAQLHGNESTEYCKALINESVGVIKVFKLTDQLPVEEVNKFFMCDFLLFDYKGENHGGNGLQFDWRILTAYNLNVPFILSGGIGLEDIRRIKALNHPSFAGIDINSKFETMPGIKDINKIKQFKTALYEV